MVYYICRSINLVHKSAYKIYREKFPLTYQGYCHIMQGMQKKTLTGRTVMDDLIKQLELYRLENRITQMELAGDIGVNFSTVSRWLNSKTKPNKIQQYHIEKFLKKKGL